MQDVSSAVPASAAASAQERATEFRPIEGGASTHSGTVLLVEAYAAIWVILFAFLWMTFRRQRQLDSRIAELERAIAKRDEKLP